MGCFGLGLSTTVSSWAYFLVLAQYYLSKKAQLKCKFTSFRFPILLQIVKIGAPGALVQAYIATRGFILNRVVILYEEDVGMAAWATVNSFGALFYAFTNGIAVAARTHFSLFVGAEDRASIKTTLKVVLQKAFPLDLLVSIAFALATPFFTRIYFHDPVSRIYHLTLILFIVCPFAMCTSVLSSTYSALFQCQKRFLVTNLMSFMDGIGGMLLSMLILCPFLKIYGIWNHHEPLCFPSGFYLPLLLQ